MTDNTYQPTLSDAFDRDKICIIKMGEISHIIELFYVLKYKKLIPEELKNEFRSAEVFCQRALATAPVKEVIYET